MSIFLGWFAHPIFGEEGDYPRIMKERMREKSRDEGCETSRLPVFTPEQIQYVKGLLFTVHTYRR